MGCLMLPPTPSTSISYFYCLLHQAIQPVYSKQLAKLRMNPVAIYVVPSRSMFPPLLGEDRWKTVCLGYI